LPAISIYGKAILGDDIKATISFEKIGEATGTQTR
jgi:hypothetical protein